MAWCHQKTSYYVSQRWPRSMLPFGMTTLWVDSYPPCATNNPQWTGSSLVQVMACRQFPEPILAFCQLDSWEQISVKSELEFYHFHSRKLFCKCRLPKWRPFCPGGDELKSCCSELVSAAGSGRYMIPASLKSAVTTWAWHPSWDLGLTGNQGPIWTQRPSFWVFRETVLSY